MSIVATWLAASAFANRELYLVLANYNRTSAEVATAHQCVPVDDPTEAGHNMWTLPARTLTILRYAPRA